MKKYTIYSLYIGLLFGLFACSNPSNNQQTDGGLLDECPIVASRQVDNHDTLTTLHLSKVKEKEQIIPLSALTNSLRLIKLENTETALVRQGGISVSEHYIGIHGFGQVPYKLFDQKGKYIHQIGSFGQGPNEYKVLYDDQIDEKNNRIYLLPWTTNQLLVFDMQGNALPPIPLPNRIPKGVFNIDTQKGQLTMGMIPFKWLENNMTVWQQDFKGNILQQVNGEQFYVGDDYSNEVYNTKNTTSFDFMQFSWVPRQDSLYHYSTQENKLYPVFTTDFENSEIIRHSFTELKDYYIVCLMTEVTAGAFGSKASGFRYILIDKSTLKGSYVKFVNDYLANIEIEYPDLAFMEGRFVQNFDPGDLKGKMETALSTATGMTEDEQSKWTQLINSFSEDDNNYILIGDIKDSHTLTPAQTTPGVQVIAPSGYQEMEKTASSLTHIDTSDSKDTVVVTTPFFYEWKNYFRENNKYKDWDAKNEKAVMIRAAVDEQGHLSQIRLFRKSGEEKLDEEALRLVKSIKQIDPAKNKANEPIKTNNFIITVYFPPK